MAERPDSPPAGSSTENGAGVAVASPTSGGPDGAPDRDGARRRRRRRRLVVAALLLVAAAIVAVVLLGSRSTSPSRRTTALPPGETTAAVTRRTLTESATVEGTLGYGAEIDLYNRLAGTFTRLPAVGSVIGRGETLWRVDNRPVVLMYGPVPVWRTLKEGVGDGPDVAELNRNLIDLGFDPYGEIDEDDHFGAATAAAVRGWQEAEHLPVTGEVELGRIVFAPGARRVTALEVAVGQDPPPITRAEEAPAEESGAEEPAAKDQAEEEKEGEEEAAEAEEAKEKAKAEEEARKRAAAEKEAKEKEAKEKPAAEKAAEEASPPEGSADEPGGEAPDEGSGSPGSEAAAAEPVLATTSTRQLVQLELAAAEQSLARAGESAPVTLPDGEVVRGRITEVGKVAEAAEAAGPEGRGEEGGEPTISVTVALDHPVTRLDEAPVSVELVKQVRDHVLAVPATVLFATAGGRYAIEALKGGRRVQLPVTPGMFADGYVQVEGKGVHADLKVTEPAE